MVAATCSGAAGMRCGVFVLAGRFPRQTDGEALARSVEAVVAAEAAGFDDVWFAEHHFMPYGVCPSAVTFAAFAAGRTSRIGVGTAVSVLSTTHPVALAEQALLVDQLSGGRLHLAVGRGGPWVDLEVFGTGLDRYERGFAEGLDLLLACLTEERVSADGDRPRPVRDPVTYTELLCSLHPIGSPRECVERLRASSEQTGIGHVMMMVEGSGDRARTLDNICRLGRDVLPHL